MGPEIKKAEAKQGKVKKQEKKVASPKKEISLEGYNIIRYPLSTEKSLRLMESENKLIFVVLKSATKAEIKSAIEEIFKVKILKVNTLITNNGEKRAYVKFAYDTPAIDIATNLGLM
jgi:large subunit ribosomal protein L23